MNRQIQGAYAVLAGALLALTSGYAIAQNRSQGQGHAQQQAQGQQQKQGPPQASQQREGDRAMEQSRDRERSMDRERTHQPSAAEAKGQSIYGGNLMSGEERNRYREQLRTMKTEQQRNEFLARHRDQMELRSRQRNVPIEVTSD